MRTHTCLCCAALSSAAVILVNGGLVAAQDAVTVAPDLYKVVLENEYVRVCEVTLRPGAKIATHWHPDQLLYFMSGGMLKMTYPDDKSRQLDQEIGDTVWISAETHNLENIGSTEVKAAVIELKKPAQPDVTPGKANVRVLFENDRVRALDVRVKPGDPDQTNWHPAYVFFALSDLKFGRMALDGKPTETILAKGQAAWNEPAGSSRKSDAKGEHVLVVELKDPRNGAVNGNVGKGEDKR